MGIHYKIKQSRTSTHTYNMPEFLKTKAEYEQAITEMCVIDFTASWCPPCRRIRQNLKKCQRMKLMRESSFIKSMSMITATRQLLLVLVVCQLFNFIRMAKKLMNCKVLMKVN